MSSSPNKKHVKKTLNNLHVLVFAQVTSAMVLVTTLTKSELDSKTQQVAWRRHGGMGPGLASAFSMVDTCIEWFWGIQLYGISLQQILVFLWGLDRLSGNTMTVYGM